MWELDCEEGWARKNWCFELWCWRRLLRVPWTARRSNQSILKGISAEYSLEGLMLKLKLQYFGHLMRRTNSFRPWCWERLRAGGEGDDRRWDGWMASPTQWTWVWVNSGVGDGQGGLFCCSLWGRKESYITEQLNWTEYSIFYMYQSFFIHSYVDAHLYFSRGVWWAAVHGVAKSWAWLSNQHLLTLVIINK